MAPCFFQREKFEAKCAKRSRFHHHFSCPESNHHHFSHSYYHGSNQSHHSCNSPCGARHHSSPKGKVLVGDSVMEFAGLVELHRTSSYVPNAWKRWWKKRRQESQGVKSYVQQTIAVSMQQWKISSTSGARETPTMSLADCSLWGFRNLRIIEERTGGARFWFCSSGPFILAIKQ